MYAPTTINGFGLGSQEYVLRVGCGGWWGYPGGLAAYARHFSFVEVNTTYYRLPAPEVARGWRGLAGAPSEFEFAVKAPRALVSQADTRRLEVEARFFEVLSVLEARYVVVHVFSDSSGAWVELAERLVASGCTPVLAPQRGGGGRTAMGGSHGWADTLGGLESACVLAWDPVLEEPPSSQSGDFYARVFGVPVGVAYHLGGGMLSLAAKRLADALRRGGVRVAVHTYRAPEDAWRITQTIMIQ
jgi:hypothetical protein